MLRRILFVLAVCGLLSGCWLVANNRSISMPPADEAGARKWWDETIARVDAATLACWHQASEFHRRRGSSATYFSHEYLGQTMAGPFYHDQYYPTPFPARLLPEVEARLANEEPKVDARADLVTVERFKNCTIEEATQAWRRHYK